MSFACEPVVCPERSFVGSMRKEHPHVSGLEIRVSDATVRRPHWRNGISAERGNATSGDDSTVTFLSGDRGSNPDRGPLFSFEITVEFTFLSHLAPEISERRFITVQNEPRDYGGQHAIVRYHVNAT